MSRFIARMGVHWPPPCDNKYVDVKKSLNLSNCHFCIYLDLLLPVLRGIEVRLTQSTVGHTVPIGIIDYTRIGWYEY
jgi:hypothetical protein